MYFNLLYFQKLPKDPSEFWYTVANFTEPNVIELEGGAVDVDGDVDGEVARRPFAVCSLSVTNTFIKKALLRKNE